MLPKSGLLSTPIQPVSLGDMEDTTGEPLEPRLGRS
jgi:hypothetical protein